MSNDAAALAHQKRARILIVRSSIILPLAEHFRSASFNGSPRPRPDRHEQLGDLAGVGFKKSAMV
jgi:hypothetical protein